MPLPPAILKVLTPFACLFTKPTWNKAIVLLIGTILTPKKRTITAALRVMGLANQPDFAKYHQVLNRAAWSPLKASRILLGLLLATFDGGGPLVFGIDETLERRWGAKIKAKGIYRDSLRSSRSPAREMQRPEMDHPDATNTNPLGIQGMGIASPHSASAVPTVLPAARTQV